MHQHDTSMSCRVDEAKTLVLKIFGIKFHPAFPNQVNMECNDACGGCGIYPNVLYGRKGIQLLAEPGHQVSPEYEIFLHYAMCVRVPLRLFFTV